MAPGGCNRCRRVLRKLADGRKVKMKYGPFARFAVNRDGTIVVFHDSMHHRKTQASAFSWGVGGEEWLKDALQGERIHAASAITDGEAQIIALFHFGLRGQIGVDCNRLCRYVQESSLFSHGAGRIGAQIHNDLVQLRGIGGNGGQVRAEVRADCDARRQSGAQQRQRLFHHRFHVD